ncbi:hypothetical protein [Luteibacter sp.]|uniref:hypothetical protein n=1 Tax=Luteibacter sp. TaxID=1886636 RepID=UPI003F81409D
MAAGAAAAVVISFAWTAAIKKVQAASLLRMEGAAEMRANDYYAFCSACGTRLRNSAIEKNVCPNCGERDSAEWAADEGKRNRKRRQGEKAARDAQDEADRKEFVRHSAEAGHAFLCDACGEEIEDDHFDFDDTKCPVCGYKGYPVITDETGDEGEADAP